MRVECEETQMCMITNNELKKNKRSQLNLRQRFVRMMEITFTRRKIRQCGCSQVWEMITYEWSSPARRTFGENRRETRIAWITWSFDDFSCRISRICIGGRLNGSHHSDVVWARQPSRIQISWLPRAQLSLSKELFQLNHRHLLRFFGKITRSLSSRLHETRFTLDFSG